MARPRWQGDEGEARRVDREDADTMRALGYSDGDITTEIRRREQDRFDADNARQILEANATTAATGYVPPRYREMIAPLDTARMIDAGGPVPPLPRGHTIDPNTELPELLLPCHDCGREIEHDDSDHAEGCRYFEAVVGDWRL